MHVFTDYESVNQHTGEKTRYVAGEGRRLTECEYMALREFERSMTEDVIPEVLRIQRLREAAWQKIKYSPLY